MSKTSKWGLFWLLVIGVFVGIILSATTVSVVQWAGSNKFCMSWCHTMDPVSIAYLNGTHAKTPSGYTAGCSDCHLTNETNHPLTPIAYVELLAAKAKAGTISLFGQIAGTISTPHKWVAHKDELSKNVIDQMTSNNFRNCRGCHHLDKMSNPKKPFVAQLHAGFIDKPTNCVACHKTAGHNYEKVNDMIYHQGKIPTPFEYMEQQKKPAPAKAK